MTREIVLDTETTGLDSATHRIVEIGCVELIDGLPSGCEFHQYVNPQRAVPREAVLIHGLDDKQLADKPVFAQIVHAFLEFIGDAPLVMHNAAFDLGFLNADLLALGLPLLEKSRAIDTLKLARKVRPGAKADLDSLCRYYKVDADRRLHGALKDAKLTAEVYLHLNGGRQKAMDVTGGRKDIRIDGISPAEWTPRLVQPTAAELAAHAAFMATIPTAIWG